jgi:erythronate-4-phosphate dehydrogenase
VNQQLLENTPVKFVASATIGTDHIDLDYLQQQGIGFANAPGCNAESAAEYMINALFELSQKRGFNPFKLTAGVIGHGNVGSRVKKKLNALGINTLVNDPPLQETGNDHVNYVSLQRILHECDFITCHVPLTKKGKYPTHHLFDAKRLAELGQGTIFFNAARGAVVDNQALSRLLQSRKDLTIFLDTWEGEPAINRTLLKQADLATPHIAGYSAEGRLRGTQMILDAACDFFRLTSDWNMQQYLPEKQDIALEGIKKDTFWHDLFNRHYRISDDHDRLLALAHIEPARFAIEFDLLRKNYPYRYEYNHFKLHGVKNKKAARIARRLLFMTT